MHHTASIADRYNKLAEENGTTYDEEIEKFVNHWKIPAKKFGSSDDLGSFVAMSLTGDFIQNHSVSILFFFVFFKLNISIQNER